MRAGLLVCLFALSACDATGSLAPADAAADVLDAETEALVLKVVREFSEDDRASVVDLKLKDTIVCGVARVEGEKKPFYVDLEDEEAFFGEGQAQGVVNAAC